MSQMTWRTSGEETRGGTLFSAIDIARAGLAISQLQLAAPGHNETWLVGGSAYFAAIADFVAQAMNR